MWDRPFCVASRIGIISLGSSRSAKESIMIASPYFLKMGRWMVVRVPTLSSARHPKSISIMDNLPVAPKVWPDRCFASPLLQEDVRTLTLHNITESSTEAARSSPPVSVFRPNELKSFLPHLGGWFPNCSERAAFQTSTGRAGLLWECSMKQRYL